MALFGATRFRILKVNAKKALSRFSRVLRFSLSTLCKSAKQRLLQMTMKNVRLEKHVTPMVSRKKMVSRTRSIRSEIENQTISTGDQHPIEGHSLQIFPADREGASIGKMASQQLIVPFTEKSMDIDRMVPESVALKDGVDEAVGQCIKAQAQFAKLPIWQRKKIIESIRDTATQFKEDFALCAWTETGRGRREDKLAKQVLVIAMTPGVEDIQPKIFTGDFGMTTVDYCPFGVIGAITPVTNPTATIINNTISILSGGNGVVFNAHPGAMKCTARAVAVLNQAVINAGGPAGVVSAVKVPTIETGGKLLKHPDTAANLVTGGPAVVKVALASGKRSFCAGPGNPPVVVDETADIKLAAKGIYEGASFDNNMVCSDEKEVFAVGDNAKRLLIEMESLGAYWAKREEVQQLCTHIFAEEPKEFKHGTVNKDLVGANAAHLLSKIGVEMPDSCRLVICDVDEGHPLIWTEQLMPILPITRVKSFEEAVDLAVRCEYGYRHTSSLYSQNLSHVTYMATKMNTALFVVNGSHTAGLGQNGEGYTSFSIAGVTGEGMTRPSTFVRERRMVCVNELRYV